MRQTGVWALVAGLCVVGWAAAARAAAPGAVVELAATTRYSCARHADGQVSCWGSGEGPDTADPAGLGPRLVPGVTGAVQLAASRGVACVRTAAGPVLCWHPGEAPTPIEGVTHAAQLTGECALLLDGSVRCWHWTPVGWPQARPVAGVAGAVALAARDGRGCAVLRPAGTVVCWRPDETGPGTWSRDRGGDIAGGVGAGAGTGEPHAVPGLSGAVEVAVGATFACSRQRDGTVRCWGENIRGELGRTTEDSPSRDVFFRRKPRLTLHPPAPVPGLAGVRSLAAAARHACVRLAGDRLLCWGDRRQRDADAPQPVPTVAAARSVGVGEDHVCALRTDGTALCWGSALGGSLGNGWSGAHPQPGAVPGITDAVRVRALLGESCAERRTGAIACWGDGDPAPRDMPRLRTLADAGGSVGDCTPEAGLPGDVRAGSLSCGLGAGCAIRTGGQVVCWRRPGHAEPGMGPLLVAASTTPAEVAGLSDAAQVAVGLDTACARRGDGRVLCWGRNGSGQVGDGTLSEGRPQPVPAAGVAGAVDVSVGFHHACAALQGGEVRCWGSTYEGEVGTYAARAVKTPVVVQGLAGTAAAAASASAPASP